MSTKDEIVEGVGGVIEKVDEAVTAGQEVLAQFDEGVTAAEGVGAEEMAGRLGEAKATFESLLEMLAGAKEKALEVKTQTAGAGGT